MTAAAAAPATRVPPALPWLIGVLVSLHGGMAAARVTASLHLLHQGRGEVWVGALLSVYALAPMVLAIWAGRLADAKGFRAPLRWAVAMGLCGCGLMLASQHLAALFIGSLLAGGSLSVGAVGIQREAGLLTDEPAQLKRVFAALTLGPAFSNAVSPVVAGLLIDHVGFRAAFAWSLAMPALAWLAGRKAAHLGGRGQARPKRAAGSSFGLLKLPALRLLLALNVVMAACWDAHTFAVPVLGHARGLSASQIGFVLGAFATAAIAVRATITALGARLEEARALRWAMWLAFAVLLAYAWLPGAWGMALGSAVLGMALGSVQPMVLALLHQVTPLDRHGQALGLRMLMTNAATVSMPLGFGALATLAVPAAPLWLMAAAVAAALPIAGRLPRAPGAGLHPSAAPPAQPPEPPPGA